MIAHMFSFRPHRSVIGVLPAIVCGLALVVGCTGGEPDPESEELSALRSERAELRRKFYSVQNGIRRTQAAALDEPGVRAAQEEFYERLRAAIVRADPAAADLLERARQIGADLDRVSGPVITTRDRADEVIATAAEQETVANELAAAELELRPHIERAMLVPEVNTAFRVLQDSVKVTMVRIDPNSAVSIERMEEIAEQMWELEVEIARLEGGR